MNYISGFMYQMTFITLFMCGGCVVGGGHGLIIECHLHCDIPQSISDPASHQTFFFGEDDLLI